ncbi:GvpL/GvpF family gas vesicle protein [Amycolatopsis sp. CA-230715]|uniref:GvpL/GvpF family gas vesicle protein n=1 Tax=Amycolatopsis sp. CA-230715 TaxID=2745196 RepID=UPI001C00FD0B|nr:GvpL/GvpF family gas vesicle protein [Amycolatopsis sp. CA-230715]
MSTYLYGIVAATHPARVDGMTGVGEEPGPVRVIDAGELKAVVGDVDAALRAKRRDLLAHETVLEALCLQGAVLPMRFGVVAEDDEAVIREVTARQGEYLASLSDVDGKVEMNLKVAHHEDAVLREILVEDGGLRRLNEDLRERGGTPDDRVRFGETVAAALAEREARDAAAIVAAVEAHARGQSDGPAVSGCFLNRSFLVDRAEVENFEAAVNAVSRSMGEVADIRIRGPLPPYSFTGAAQPA